MAASFVAAGAVVETLSAATTIAVPVPAGIAANDTLVALVTVGASAQTPAPAFLPAGWMGSVFTVDPAPTPPQVYVAWKTATGSETGTVTFTIASQVATGQMLAFRGIEPTSMYDALVSKTQNPAATSFTFPSLTPTVSGTALVYVIAETNLTGTPGAAPTGFTETGRSSAGASGITRVSVFGHQTPYNSVTPIAPTQTWSASSKATGFLIALHPALGETVLRSSRSALDVLERPNPDNRVTRAALDVLELPTPDLRATRAAMDVLYSTRAAGVHTGWGRPLQ